MFDEELDQLGGGRRNTFSEWFLTAILLCRIFNIAFAMSFHCISFHFLSCIVLLYCTIVYITS